METRIVITELDFIRLNKIISSAKIEKCAELKNLDFLAHEIKRANRVDSKKITPEFVTMNSVVQVVNKETKQPMTVKIVYPQDADFKKGNISVFSPLGSALLGYKVGDKVSFDAPKGKVEMTVKKIEYQPEAHGEFLE